MKHNKKINQLIFFIIIIIVGIINMNIVLSNIYIQSPDTGYFLNISTPTQNNNSGGWSWAKFGSSLINTASTITTQFGKLAE